MASRCHLPDNPIERLEDNGMVRFGIRWLAGVVGLSLMAVVPGRLAADDTAEVKKAKALIEAEAKRIWRLAHITVKKYKAFECDGLTKTDTGFKLGYTYTWAAKEKGKEVEHTTKLAFKFNPKGEFDGIKKGEGMEVVSDSSKIKAFEGADLVVLPLRVYMKKNIALLPKSIKAVVEEEIEDKIKASRFLELWLMFRGYVAAPKDDD